MGIRNNKAFSLIEILVAVVCTFIVAVGFVTIQRNLGKGSNDLALVNTIIEKKRVFDAVLSDRQAFLNTINRPENANMACVRNGGTCDARYVANAYNENQDRIVVYDANNNLFYDGRATNTKGFTEQGTACDGFQYTGPGNDKCPIGFAVSWYLGSSDLAKSNNITFVAKMVYNPSDKNSQKRKINTLVNSEMNAYDAAQVFSLNERPATNVVSCQQSGVDIFNGGVYRFFQTPSVNLGSTCNSEARVCTVVNGVASLSGSFTEKTCAQSCYGEFTSCTAPCGGGTRTFNHIVERNNWGSDCAYPHGYTEACNTQSCAAVVDCQGSWGACSATCGGGQQIFNVTTPAANGGAACPTSPQSCNTQACALPTDCQGTWSACSATCGGGQKTFSVTVPAANGGLACPTSPQSCNTQSCIAPVDCEGTWGACSATCGGGTQNFIVTRPAANGGAACPTTPRSCNTQACDIDCEGTWGSCSATCGGGTQNFNRTIAPSGNGAACPISPRSCNTQTCPPDEPVRPAPVDCQGSWGACSAACGGGTRTFNVTVPAANGGQACPTTEACNTQGCPVDCAGSWGSCSLSCGGGVETFNISVQPANGGNSCPISPRSCNPQACQCSNGAVASSYPACDSCPSGQALVNGTCQANCTNGATNPPQCNACELGFTYNSASGKCENDPCGDRIFYLQARQTVTGGSNNKRAVIVTPIVQNQSYCSDNGYSYIPRDQHTVEWFVKNTPYHMCMYPGMPSWYDGGRWVGMNYFSSGNEINYVDTGGYALVRTKNPSYTAGHATLASFLQARPKWHFVQGLSESIDQYNTFVCLRAPYVPSSGGSGVSGGGSGGGSSQQRMDQQ